MFCPHIHSSAQSVFEMLSRLALVPHHRPHEIITEKRPISRAASPGQICDNPDALIYSGALYKKSTKTHSYKKKWFVLRNSQLSYYKDSKEHKPLKVFACSDIQSFDPRNERTFEQPHFTIYTSKKKLHLYAENQREYDLWKEGLNQVIGKQDFKTEHPPPLLFSEGVFSGAEDPNYTSCASDHQSSPQNDTHMGEAFKTFQDTKEKKELLSAEAGKEIIVEKGRLLRLYKRLNQWKKLDIVLTNKALYIYKVNPKISETLQATSSIEHIIECANPIKIIKVLDLVDIIELDPLSKTKIWCLLIITKAKRIRFCAESESELVKWLTAIKMLLSKRK